MKVSTTSITAVRCLCPWIAAVAALALTALLAGEVYADIEAVMPLRLQLGQFSKKVKQYLDSTAPNAAREISVGTLRYRIPNEANRCPGLQMLIKSELENAGIVVRESAAHQIVGDYLFHVDEEGRELHFVMNCHIRRTADNTALWQETVRVSYEDQGLSPEGWIDFVNYMKGRPTPFRQVAAATRSKPAQSDRSGPFRMAVYTMPDGQYTERKAEYRPAADGSGQQCFVRIERGESFGIMVENNWDWDVAVELTLDGLNCFVFSENREYSYFIVPRQSKGYIAGWHRNNQTADAFLGTDYAQSAAAQFLVSPDETGLITARIASAWTSDEDRPPNEPHTREAFIGRGGKVPTNCEPTERYVGKQWTMLHVRYKK